MSGPPASGPSTPDGPGPEGTPFARAADRLSGWTNAVADLGKEADAASGPADADPVTGPGDASAGSGPSDASSGAPGESDPGEEGKGAGQAEAGAGASGPRRPPGSGTRWSGAGRTARPGSPPAGPDERAADADLASAAAAAEVEVDLELAAIARQRDDYLDALRHLQADFENYRKRVEKQRVEHVDRATGEMIAKLLPVCDTVDLAIAHGGGEEVKHVWTALFDTLERLGLERIDPVGVPFDPTVHDAVAHEPGDSAAAPEVVEVMRAGYLWKGRVLRPAMVKVRG